MHNGEEVITKDFQSILLRNGFSTQEFKITIKNGSSYDPNQIVSTQVWITIERDFIQKKYGLYRTNWPYDFESDLNNGYFNP